VLVIFFIGQKFGAYCYWFSNCRCKIKDSINAKPNILFIPASIRSHIVPSFYIANLLAADYEITYAVTNNILKELVEANSFRSINITGYKVLLGMEMQFAVTELKVKPTFCNYVKTLKNKDLANFRKKELKTICEKINPKAIFIDIFSSTDFVLLKGLNYTQNLFFFNPMPSTYRVKNYPIVSDAEFVSTKNFETKLPLPKPKLNLKAWILDFKKSYISKKVYECNIKTLRDNNLDISDLAENNEFTIGFKNIPEFVLIPLEFEFSEEVKKPWQYYLGLCTCKNRKETEQDDEFSKQWPTIQLNSNGRKVIYCSFGTFYTGSDRTLLSFLENLIEVIESFKDCILIVSVNTYVIQTLQNKTSKTENIHFFKRVPQLEVLKYSDVFITHGGMGSIKEAIEYKVPMLVYPLDPHYDQNGNALKIETKKLGLKGNFKFEKKSDLELKLKTLLKNEEFRHKNIDLHRQCDSKYSQNLSTLQQVIR
jgi:UDP:flavonoid glycosyltransferase YjiC (YdhE family)